MSGALRFNSMHFMPYVHLPENHKDYKSLWVSFPNKYYDPEKGHELYKRYLRELVLADQLGFDAHRRQRASQHRLQHDGDAEPDRRRARAADQERAHLRLGYAAQLHAAEPAGRGVRHPRRHVEGPARDRASARHRHGVLGEPGQSGDGAREVQGIAQDHAAGLDRGRPDHPLRQFYTYRFLNPWPRPYQKPHPPCYIVGTGSPETIEIAAELGFGYASVFVTQQRAHELNETLRQRAAHYGHTLRPDQLPLLTFVYVAETQERAEQEYIAHLQRFFEDYARTTPQFLAPPGYLSVDQLKMRAAMADKMHGGFDFKAISKSFFIAVGTPDKVANQIGEWSQWMKTNHINCVMHVADMPHWKTVKNLTLFAEEVMPRLRSRASPPLRAAAE